MPRPSLLVAAALAAAMLPMSLPSAIAKPAVAPAAERKFEIANDRYEYYYAYPAAAMRIPALRAHLEAEIRRDRAKFEKYGAEEQDNARASGYEYRPISMATGWSVVTALPGWISLSAGIEDYLGGAHPNHNFDGLLWDIKAGRKREVWELFTSKDALRKAIRADFCRELDKQREERREEKIAPGSSEIFEVCIDPFDSTVILGSSTRKAFDRIGVLIAPYAAGPYVEGSYEVTLPVTAKVLALVKPQYRTLFAVKR